MDTQVERCRIAGAMAIVLGLLAHPGAATTITVNSTVDALANTGSCTLREAIIAANQNAPSGAAPGECPAGSSGSTDTILLPSGTFQLSLAGTESSGAVVPAVGDLDITQNLNIVGQGPAATIVDALSLGARLFHVDFASAQVSFQGLTIRNGVSNGNGAGIYFEDGTSLTLTNVRVFNNSATSGSGGGISAPNTSNVTLTDVQIVGNSTEDNGGGLHWNECAGCTSNSLTILRSLVTLNSTTGSFFAEGGGLNAGTGNIFITESTIDENHATSGGGIRVEGSLFATSSTFSNNTAEFSGGGIFFDFHDSAQLTNCTITNNEAAGAGGGIASFSNESSTLTNCTIAENDAPTGTAIDNADELVLVNTIVSGTCSDGFAVSQGGNVESPGDNCGLDHATDLVAVSASSLSLGPLADNGGRTLTHLIGDSSAARDRGRDAFCPALDQTGVPRPSVGNCDSGSVEAGARLIFEDGFESGNLSAWS